jgi:hypothetical protein
MHGHSKKSYIANDDKQKESWYEMKYERFIGKHYRITLIGKHYINICIRSIS